MMTLSRAQIARRYRERHPDRIRKYRKRLARIGYYKKYRKAHHEETLTAARLVRARNRLVAMTIVAQRWGDDEPRCRFDTLPETHSLRTQACFGQLQIDHMRGGGTVEYERGPFWLFTKIRSGERKLDDLRILCQLHQLWNCDRSGALRTGSKLSQ